MATLAIGDIHGNIRALDDLLDKISPEVSANDTVVFLGDYIDRGPDTKQCIDRILQMRQASSAKVVALLGNHEEWMIRTYQDHTRHSWILGMGGFSTIQSYSEDAAFALTEAMENLGPRVVTERVSLPYQLFFDSVPPEHQSFFLSLSIFCRTPEAVCVHGGLDPTVAEVEEQKPEHLIWGGDGFPELYQGSDYVIYGHANNPVMDSAGWPHPRIVGRTSGLDTIEEGVLTAFRVPDGAVFQSRRFL